MFNITRPQKIQLMRCVKNDVERGRPQMTIWCMHMAYEITKATNTCSLHIILTAFPLQQWLD